MTELADVVLRAEGGVERVEPDWQGGPCAIPNDHLWPQQSAALSHICLPGAWDKQRESKVIVAVLDSGVDYTHPDVQPNLWRNMAEVNGLPGVDDDGYGIVDDFWGASFLSDVNDPQYTAPGDPRDRDGHGTEVLSILGSRADNAGSMSGNCATQPPCPDRDMAGVIWKGAILPVKVYGFGPLVGSDVFQGMEYAYFKGARIMNMSFRTVTDTYKPYWMELFMLATPDVLYVAAAGNEDMDLDDDSDHYHAWPPEYHDDVPNMLVVGATTPNDTRWSDFPGTLGSNWGKTRVDLFAPGETVPALSPLPGTWLSSTGTSDAAPLVAGVAALAWTANPQYSVQDLKQKILSTVDHLQSLNGLCVTGGRLNAARALGGTCP